MVESVMTTSDKRTSAEEQSIETMDVTDADLNEDALNALSDLVAVTNMVNVKVLLDRGYQFLDDCYEWDPISDYHVNLLFPLLYKMQPQHRHMVVLSCCTSWIWLHEQTTHTSASVWCRLSLLF